jgi:hypothetical protein
MELRNTIVTTPSSMATLTTFEKGFTPTTHPILPQRGPPPWRTYAITIDHSHINLDIDMKPTGQFSIHHHPTIPTVAILYLYTGRTITTLFLDSITHLYRLFRPELTHLTFEEELYRLVTRVDTTSEIDAPTTIETHKNRWATREDLLHVLRTSLNTATEMCSDHLNK